MVLEVRIAAGGVQKKLSVIVGVGASGFECLQGRLGVYERWRWNGVSPV